MKIEGVRDIGTEKTQKKAEKGEKSFAFTLQGKMSEAEFVENINSMVSNISKQGDVLAEHMDLKDLKKYKAMISEFIEELVSKSHKFSKENFLDRRGRHKVYGIIRVINKDLDDIAQEMLKEEKNHITILEKIDEIRGLLLDIVT